MKEKSIFYIILFAAILCTILLATFDYNGNRGSNPFLGTPEQSSLDPTQNIHQGAAISNATLPPVKTEVKDAVSPEEPLLVVIDAGHGGIDPGCVDNGLKEKDIVLDIALKLNEILKKSDIATYMIREGDDFVDHEERIEIANDKNAALFLSIHCDWFEDKSVNGTQTLYMPSRALKKGKLIEIDYALTIQEELMNSLKTNDRGINDRSDLAVLSSAKMPSVIVELGFLSSEKDVVFLKSSDFREKTAEALARGIQKSLLKINGEE